MLIISLTKFLELIGFLWAPLTHYGKTKNLLWEETLIGLYACGDC